MAAVPQSDQLRVGARQPELNSALCAVERAAGDHLEADLPGVELERGVLVPDRDTREFDGVDHLARAARRIHHSRQGAAPVVDAGPRCSAKASAERAEPSRASTRYT